MLTMYECKATVKPQDGEVENKDEVGGGRDRRGWRMVMRAKELTEINCR